MRKITRSLLRLVALCPTLFFAAHLFATPPGTQGTQPSTGTSTVTQPPVPPHTYPPPDLRQPPPDIGSTPPGDKVPFTVTLPVNIDAPLPDEVAKPEGTWDWERQPDGTVILKIPQGTTTIRISNMRGNVTVLGIPDGTTAQKPGPPWVVIQPPGGPIIIMDGRRCGRGGPSHPSLQQAPRHAPLSRSPWTSNPRRCAL